MLVGLPVRPMPARSTISVEEIQMRLVQYIRSGNYKRLDPIVQHLRQEFPASEELLKLAIESVAKTYADMYEDDIREYQRFKPRKAKT